MTLSESNSGTVKSCYQKFGSGDIPAFFEMLADDVQWNSQYTSDVRMHGTFNGKTEISDLFGIMFADLTITAFSPRSFLANEDTVVVIGSEEAIVKATSKNYVNEWVHVWELRDGIVVRISSYNQAENVRLAFQD